MNNKRKPKAKKDPLPRTARAYLRRYYSVELPNEYSAVSALVEADFAKKTELDTARELVPGVECSPLCEAVNTTGDSSREVEIFTQPPLVLASWRHRVINWLAGETVEVRRV